MRGPEINKPKSATAPPATSASCGLQPRPRPGGPSRPSSIAPPKPINHNFAAPDSFGTHAPTDQENQPEMPEREHAGADSTLGALPTGQRQPPLSKLLIQSNAGPSNMACWRMTAAHDHRCW